MASEITHRLTSADADSDGNLQMRYENRTGTPLDAVEYLGGSKSSGAGVGGEYVITIGSGATTCDVVTDQPSKHPFEATGVSITCDGATWNYGVIPGCRVKFSSGAAQNNVGVVTLGQYMLDANTITDVLLFGIVEAGNTAPSDNGLQITALNTGDADSAQTKVDFLPGSYFTGDEELAFIVSILPHTDPAEHKSALDPDEYRIKFIDWGTISGGQKTADIQVSDDDGSTWYTAVEDAVFDGASVYQKGHASYDDGNDYLKGFGIILASTVVDPTSLDIRFHVLDGYQYVELAPNASGGVPGSFASGPLTLTEDGQAAGVVRSSYKAYWHVRYNLPEAASPGDLRGFRLKTYGLTI